MRTGSFILDEQKNVNITILSINGKHSDGRA